MLRVAASAVVFPGFSKGDALSDVGLPARYEGCCSLAWGYRCKPTPCQSISIEKRREGGREEQLEAIRNSYNVRGRSQFVLYNIPVFL